MPALLSDTLVTFEREDGGPLIDFTAANFDWMIKGDPKRALSRKLVIEGRCAAAMAGDGHLINELRNTLHWELSKWELTGRPMRQFGDKANLYKSRGVLEALGIWVAPDGKTINSMGAYGLRELGALGMVSAVGSGGAAMLDLARQFEPTLVDVATSDTKERIRGFAAAVNGKRLANELLGHIGEDTGGYVEYAYFEHDAWHRGPKALSVFVKFDLGCGTFELNPRAFAYDPDEGGRILVLDAGPDPIAAEFDLQRRTISSQLQRWFGWVPDACSITFYQKRRDGPGAWTSTVSSRSDQASEITFDFSADRFSFSPGTRFLQESIDNFLQFVRRKSQY